MTNASLIPMLKIALSLKNLISATKEMDGENREFLVENLLGATSPEYLESIEEARRDCKYGEELRRGH